MSAPVPAAKAIPSHIQRRASKLPCDGAPRYKVGKQKNLTYSQAYDAILEEVTLKKDENGHRTLKHGGALRLVNLNKLYFSVASEAVQKMIDDKKAANAAAAKDKKTAAAPIPGDEPGVTVPDNVVDISTADAPDRRLNTQTGEVSKVVDLTTMVGGDKLEIFQVGGTEVLAKLSLSPKGDTYRLTIGEQEPIRTRNLDKVKEALEQEFYGGWEARKAS